MDLFGKKKDPLLALEIFVGRQISDAYHAIGEKIVQPGARQVQGWLMGFALPDFKSRLSALALDPPAFFGAWNRVHGALYDRVVEKNGMVFRQSGYDLLLFVDMEQQLAGELAAELKGLLQNQLSAVYQGLGLEAPALVHGAQEQGSYLIVNSGSEKRLVCELWGPGVDKVLKELGR